MIDVQSFLIFKCKQEIEKIGAEGFGELRNIVLEENGEDKMARESN